MISVNDLKNGLTLELDNGLWTVVEFLHVKPGKGAAFVRTKLKNVETGNTMEKTFRAGEKFPKATLEKKFFGKFVTHYTVTVIYALKLFLL